MSEKAKETNTKNRNISNEITGGNLIWKIK